MTEAMDNAVFKSLCDVVYSKSGITLGPGKQALMGARLGKRLRALGCPDYEAYLDLVLHDRAGDEVVKMLDAISTNVTSFFREPAHFDFVRDVAGKWLKEGRTRLRCWSAACSSGEEPYTLAMTLMGLEGAARTDIRILATDISTRVLELASAGLYEKAKLGNIPEPLRRQWMEPAGEGRFRVVPELRKLVSFRRMNLSQPPFPMQGPIDLILCRNVMIYFDQRVRAGILGEASRLLRPGGYLLVGHSESLAGTGSGLKTVQASIYQKPS